MRNNELGEWFIEIYPHSGGLPTPPKYFSNFNEILEFVIEFNKHKINDILRVHIPAVATNDERQQLVENGAILT